MNVIGLFDCNNFYASCERVFNPRLNGKPVIVLSNNDGCVVSRSAEAKALGIPMAVPVFKIRDQIKREGVVVLSSNYALYGDMSRRVMRLLGRYSPMQEIYSIDESFLDLGHAADPASLAKQIRQDVLQRTGIPIAAGIASTKTLAKLANFLAKKHAPWRADGVCHLTAVSEQDRSELFANIPVEEVWGVGRQHNKHLNALGITTVEQLRCADPIDIRRRFSVVVEHTVRELNGCACLALEPRAQPRQQIVVSRGLGEKTDSFDSLRAAIASHTNRACEKLRAQSSVTSAIGVHISTSPFKLERSTYSRSVVVQLITATDDPLVLQTAAAQGLRQIFRANKPYCRAGIWLPDLQPKGVGQAELFQSIREREQTALAIDAIKNRFGRAAIRTANTMLSASWMTRRQNLSPCYTSEWDQIPVVGSMNERGSESSFKSNQRIPASENRI